MVPQLFIHLIFWWYIILSYNAISIMNITLIITMLTIIIAASTSISMGKELKERKKNKGESGEVMRSTDWLLGGWALVEPPVCNNIHERLQWSVHKPRSLWVKWAIYTETLSLSSFFVCVYVYSLVWPSNQPLGIKFNCNNIKAQLIDIPRFNKLCITAPT